MAILKTPKPRKESMHSPKPKSLKRVSTLSLTSSKGRSAASMPYFSIITRISDGFGESSHDRSGAAFGIEYLFPEGHGLKARERGLIQFGPGQCVRVELGISLHEMAAERVAMLERSDFHAAAFLFFGPMN